MRNSLWLSFAMLCVAALPVHAQDNGGVVDTRRSTQAQIDKLESLTRRDTPPEKMTVYLRWLADLYTSTGDLDAAQGAYERILVLDPYDLATTNLLAQFLLDQRHDAAAADTLLSHHIAWASKSEPQPIYLGQSYALHARALRSLGRYEDALDAGNHAVARLDPDAAEDAMRTQAVSLKELGKNEEAAAVFEQLIGITGGSNADDINALIAIETEKSGSIDADAFHAQVRATIENAREKRAESLRYDGAEMVELEGEGHVRLEATLRRGKGPNAVVFVPDLGGRRSAFTPYAQLMHIDGFTTLAIDPRGHGGSRCDSLPSFLELTADQRDRIPSDIATAQRYLREQLKIPADHIVIVAEGAACADVERAMHDLNLGAVVVHLSPVFDPQDRDVASAIAFRSPRPALMVVSEEDVYSVQSVNLMRDARPPDLVTVRTVHRSGHGVKILHQPANYAMVASWIEDQLAATR